MNRYYRSAIVLATLSAAAVKGYDEGKTKTPPASVVGQLLAVSSASSGAVVVSSVATLVAANTITGAVYDAWFGRGIGGDEPSRPDLTYASSSLPSRRG